MPFAYLSARRPPISCNVSVLLAQVEAAGAYAVMAQRIDGQPG
jgi:hypothetical protein